MNRSTRVSSAALLLVAGLALAQGNVNAEDQAAPRVGSLNLPGVHGLGFGANDGSNAALALQVVATSRSPEAVTPASLPDDWAVRLPDVPPGRYVREEWDKGAALRDNWSARWTGTLHVEKEGEYTFYLTTDDGARLRLDDQLAIDFWQPRPPTTSEAKVKLTAGDHPLVAEFFEAGGGAVARLEWSGEGLERQVLPPERVTSDGQPGWKAEYFNNPSLEGQPARVEHVERIDTDWGEGGPRIGEEEPGPVTLEWTCDEPGHMVGRIHAGADTYVGLVAQFSGDKNGRIGIFEAAATVGNWTLTLRPIGELGQLKMAMPYRGRGGAIWLWYAPSEDSGLFEAHFQPKAKAPDNLPMTSPEVVRQSQALRDAFQAGRKPNLPPYPADAEGWISLFNGKDTAGWKMRNPGAPNHWQAVDGLLQNVQGGGSDIYTEGTFTDFDLHVEFRVPPGSNSGVYLQGIYEIQVDDCFGQELRDTMCGAVYHKITPSVNAAKPAGEWQTFDVNFRAATIDDHGQVVPARVTLVFNGVKTIDDQEIDGITGSAMSDRVLEPGPLMFQGDHGPVDYRNVKIRPR